jgi:hypothetical protein
MLINVWEKPECTICPAAIIHPAGRNLAIIESQRGRAGGSDQIFDITLQVQATVYHEAL